MPNYNAIMTDEVTAKRNACKCSDLVGCDNTNNRARHGNNKR